MKSLSDSVNELQQLACRLMEENQVLREQIKELQLQLKQRKHNPPPQIKPSVKKKSHQKHKRRRKAYVRKKNANPDKVVLHAQHQCPDCLVSITGNSIAYEREVIEIPIVTATTTKHIILKRRCWKCSKTWMPEVDWSAYVMSKSRFGVRLASLVNTMTEHLRQPISAVQSHLSWIYDLHISKGSIIELRHKVAHKGAVQHRRLEGENRGSLVVNADETSHRENGVNGYTWSYSTPKIRYFLYGRGRGAGQVEEVLGGEFEGVLVTDYYAAYNIYDGEHQRCWAHLLRDIKKLVKLHEDNQVLKDIQIQIKELFKTGKLIQKSQLTLKQRNQCKKELETMLLDVVKPYWKKSQKKHPFHTIAKRIDKYIDEHFTYVLSPEIPATNNAAERAVRHGVIARKISGGTISKAGTRTKEILASLFGTWHVREQNPFEKCMRLLTNPNYSIVFV